MKQKYTVKSLLVAASIFSLFAFLFVNIHSNSREKKGCVAKSELVQSKLEAEEENDRKIVVPDVTILGRVLEIAQKLIVQKN